MPRINRPTDGFNYAHAATITALKTMRSLVEVRKLTIVCADNHALVSFVRSVEFMKNITIVIVTHLFDVSLESRSEKTWNSNKKNPHIRITQIERICSLNRTKRRTLRSTRMFDQKFIFIWEKSENFNITLKLTVEHAKERLLSRKSNRYAISLRRFLTFVQDIH